MARPSDVRSMAILSIAAPALARWPRDARIAFRNAVMDDPEPFLIGGQVDRGAVLIEAQVFLACWERGAPWPPVPIPVSAPAPTRAAPREIEELARVAAAIGIQLALALRGGS